MAKRITSRFTIIQGITNLRDKDVDYDYDSANHPLAYCLQDVSKSQRKQTASEFFFFYIFLALNPCLQALEYLSKKHGANPNYQIAKRTSLHIAGIKGTPGAVIRLIVDLGGKINAKDSTGFTPLFYALIFGKVTCAREMIECGATAEEACPPKWKYTLDKVIAFKDNHDDGFWNSKPSWERIALAEMKVDEVKFWKSLYLYLLITQLAPHHQDPGDFSAVRELLQKGARASMLIGVTTALHEATAFSNSKILKLILKASCNFSVDELDAFGWTPLMRAIEYSNVKAVKRLSRKGASFDVETIEGTPRKMAEERCNVDLSVISNAALITVPILQAELKQVRAENGRLWDIITEMKIQEAVHANAARKDHAEIEGLRETFAEMIQEAVRTDAARKDHAEIKGLQDTIKDMKIREANQQAENERLRKVIEEKAAQAHAARQQRSSDRETCLIRQNILHRGLLFSEENDSEEIYDY